MRPPASTVVQWIGVLIGVGVLAVVIVRDRMESAEYLSVTAAEEARQVAERTRLFRQGTLAEILDSCRSGWRDSLNYYHEPSALAFTRNRIDGYYLDGADARTWRRLECNAHGMKRGPRVERPFLDALPPESPDPGWTAWGEAWHIALSQIGTERLTDDELGLEVLIHPATLAVIIRRWRGLEGGAKAYVEPPDTPRFTRLIGAKEFRYATGEAPPAIKELQTHNWRQDPDAAFALLAENLPDGALVAELEIADDKIEIRIEWPTPAFDGDPPAPYGDMDFDEYGVANSTYWYPRTDPGLGCREGRHLDAVHADLVQAMSKARARPFQMMWFSCSSAYSDGVHGVWNLGGPDPS